MYEAETAGVRVWVEPRFLEAQSDPAVGRYVWRYDVIVENRRNDTIQLIARQWSIFDADGQREDVNGLGVVGEQPHIPPNDRFRYRSGAPLRTPSGLMRGSYHMLDGAGESFRVEIPAFSLDSPYDDRPKH